MLNGARLTYFLVMASTVFVQLAVFAIAKIDETGKVAADLATYLMLSAFSVGVLTLGGVNVTVDMSRRGKLNEEFAFYFLAVIGGVVALCTFFLVGDHALLRRLPHSLVERAAIAFYVLLTVLAALSGSVSAVFGSPRDSSSAERLYVLGVVVFLIGALLKVDAKLCAYVIAGFGCLVFSRRLLNKNIKALLVERPRVPTGPGKSVLTWNLSNSILAYGFQYLDTLLVGVCLTQRELGVYFFLVQLSFVPKYFSVQLGRVILPYLNQIDQSGDADLNRLKARLFYFIFVVILGSVGALVGMRNGGLDYFGSSYAAESVTLSVLMSGSILSLPGPILYSVLIANGYTKEFARVNILGGVVLLALQLAIFLLSDRLDLFSSFAMARFASTALCQVLLIWLVRKKLPVVWGVTKEAVLVAVIVSFFISAGSVWESLKA